MLVSAAAGTEKDCVDGDVRDVSEGVERWLGRRGGGGAGAWPRRLSVRE